MSLFLSESLFLSGFPAEIFGFSFLPVFSFSVELNIRSFYSQSHLRRVRIMKGWLVIGACILGIAAFIGVLCLINSIA